MIARPEFHGLCFHHGTFRPRASRQDNFRREVTSLANGTHSETDFLRTAHALLRGFAEGHISLDSFSVLSWLTSLIHQTHVHALTESFNAGKGPAWDTIRKIIDSDDDGSQLASRKKQS
jgi:hypothetical protein